MGNGEGFAVGGIHRLRPAIDELPCDAQPGHHQLVEDVVVNNEYTLLETLADLLLAAMSGLGDGEAGDEPEDQR